MKYRSSIEIILAVLKIVLTPQATRTRIMYGSRLSYNQTVEYLDLLLSKKLVEFDDKTEFYSVTEKGIRLCVKSEELLALMASESPIHIVVEKVALVLKPPS